MKKAKFLLILVLTTILLFSSSFVLFSGKAYAVEPSEEPEEETAGQAEGSEPKEIVTSGYTKAEEEAFVYSVPKTQFEFNAGEILKVYASNSTGGNDTLKKRQELKITGYDFYPVNDDVRGWFDNMIDSTDASAILNLERGYTASKNSEGVDVPLGFLDSSDKEKYESWISSIQELRKTLVDNLKKEGKEYSEKDVVVTATVNVPKISYKDGETLTEAASYTISTADGKISEQALNTIRDIENIYNNISEGTDMDVVDFTIVSVTAKTPDDREFYLTIGTDNNFYFIAESVKQENSTKQEFSTELNYRAESNGKVVEGKKDGKTFLPPYYENEDKDAKKDADAIAIINSKTDEEIVATNGVALTDKNTKENPNSEGWYYPDVTNKKVIEKVYPFDTYNNPKDNGAVEETVKLTGKDGGEDSQTPSIRWTLRRINYDEKTNGDGSITVTITYNLPIDPASIPDGWKGIADEDGGIRRIVRTFKPGENYDKNVTVEQNGPSKATVTTPVKINWTTAKDLGPQAGAFTVVLAIVAGGVMVFAITRYRKLNK